MKRHWLVLALLGAVALGVGIAWAIDRVAEGGPLTPTPSATATQTAVTAVAPPVPQAALLVATDLRSVPGGKGDDDDEDKGKGAKTFVAYDAGKVPTLICQQGWASSLGAGESATVALKTEGPAKSGYGEVREAILSFQREDQTQQAYDAIRGWLDSCDASLVSPEHEVERDEKVSAVEVDGGIGAATVVTYCLGGDCDVKMKSRLVVTRIGQRIVLLAYAESKDNDGFTDRARSALATALDKARAA